MNEDADYEVEPDDEEEDPETEQPNDGDSKERTSFNIPAGFSWSLLPNMDDFVDSVIAALQEQFRSAMPDYRSIGNQALAPIIPARCEPA